MAMFYYLGSVLLLNATLRSIPVSVATDLVVVIDAKDREKQTKKNAKDDKNKDKNDKAQTVADLLGISTLSLDHCEGHCMSGSDCSGDLKCISPDEKGDKFEEILEKFGCEGETEKDTSYCVDSSKKIVPTAAPTKKIEVPTQLPTAAAKEVREQSRHWTEMVNISRRHAKLKDDGEIIRRAAMARERNPFRFTDAPTSSPTTLSPTESPTLFEDREEYPVNRPPLNPPKDYFDYSVGPSRDSAIYYMKTFSNARGPAAWGSLGDAPSTREGRYWSQFAEYFKPEKGGGHDIVSNVCATGTRQSPIDVTHKLAQSQCFEYHEIRHRAGDFGVYHPLVEKQILPSKLRLHYPREYFMDPDLPFGEQRGEWGDRNKFGPSADLPKRWGYQLPVTHIDIKIPSEHYLEGKQYSMEYQVNLMQMRDEPYKGRGAGIVSVLFDIHPDEEDNEKMGELIEAFEKVWNKDKMECEDFQRKKRRLDAKLYSMVTENEEAKFQSKLRAARRLADEDKDWDPWHKSILRTIWFMGYQGSLTEPPCSELAEWRIMREPAYISTQQLNRLKNILFNHVDSECRRTSVHSKENGVARPLQHLNNDLYTGHNLFECTCLDFLSDLQREELKQNKCAFYEREEFGFDPDIYTKEWNARTHQYDSAEEFWAATGTEPWWA